MGCPMKQNSLFNGIWGSNYPFESLHRPWSWSLSTFMNVFLAFFLLWIGWKMIRRNRNKKDTKLVPLRYEELNVVEGKPKALVIGGRSISGKAVLEEINNKGQMNSVSLDLHIPTRSFRDPFVSSYFQCDPGNKEDLMIALQNSDTVFVTQHLTIPDTVDTRDELIFEVTEKMIKNIIECCKECGVKRLLAFSCLSNVARKVKDSGGFEEVTITEMTLVEGCNGIEEIVLKENSETLKTCIIRCGLIYVLEEDEGRYQMENPTKLDGIGQSQSFPGVLSDYLATVAMAAEGWLNKDSVSDKGPIFLACDKSTTKLELDLHSNKPKLNGSPKESPLANVIVNPSETKRVLQLDHC